MTGRAPARPHGRGASKHKDALARRSLLRACRLSLWPVIALRTMGLHPVVKMTIYAFVITGVIFLWVFACVPNDWIMLVSIVPMLATPVPMLLVRCCGDGDGILSSSPKGRHCALATPSAHSPSVHFFARVNESCDPNNACCRFAGAEFWSSFFLTTTIAFPFLFYATGAVSAKAFGLALGGVFLLGCFLGGNAIVSARSDDDAFHAW